ncbi:MAG: ATP-binding protein [Endomicrobium sp.]|jgi:predicted AAA+ superfamily ATPase|uniref:ATP-binding protein n=1 Tax=Candidatus Endomicrobiellum cubanum TaxID=3242325 RepID=UPI002839C2EA|nr:ATP-binding protein [Endomicrobium sp.]MDR2395653.1 ATP-binding protein [Endomicrobium sp.]
MIKRDIEKKIISKIGKGKAIIVYGARQVGKTTLIKDIFGNKNGVLWLNGDDDVVRATFENINTETFRPIIGPNKTIIIDEAQRIKDIGLKLKIIQDNFGDQIQLVATGSSSFDLANKINEPMTGRKWNFWLAPLSFWEMEEQNGLIAEKMNLENRLLYGSYPDVVTNPSDARDRIKELARDSLYRDVLNLGEIIKTDKLEKILQALSFQIGSQASMNEIAGLVGLDSKTVDKYISLLEKSFVIFRLTSYSSNLRNELKSSQKFYFYDTGIRNAVIDNFQPLALRQDIGPIFENYIIAEMKKRNSHKGYFWRTTKQQEIDYIAEKTGELSAIEIKWNEKRPAKIPKTFSSKYHPNQEIIINRTNYADMLLKITSQFD